MRVCVCVMQNSVIGAYMPSSSSVKTDVTHRSVLLDALQSVNAQSNSPAVSNAAYDATVTADAPKPGTRAKRTTCKCEHPYFACSLFCLFT